MSLPARVECVLSKPQAVALANIRAAADKATKRESLIHFTDHTVAHLDKVACNFVDLCQTSEKTDLRLTPDEYFVGLSACYLHDVALQATISSNRNVTRLESYNLVVQRNQHGLAASHAIEQQLAEPTEGIPLHLPEDETLRKLVQLAAPLCKFHCSDMPAQDLAPVSILETTIRMDLLLRLLRVADCLHLDFQRVDMKQLAQHEIPAESKFHWWRHHFTDAVAIDRFGTITITMGFPSLSAPEQDFFVDATYRYVEAELSQHLKIFRENGIGATLLPISISDAFSRLKETLPDDLKRWMNYHGFVGVGSAPTSHDLEEESSWPLKTWGVRAHPWVDLPSSCVRAEYVATAEVTGYMAHVKSFLASGRGEIRMLYGSRGIGKTTFLYSVRDQFGAEADSVYLDLSRVFGELETPSQLYIWLFQSLVNKLGDDGPPPKAEDIPKRLRAAMELHERPIIVLIDNLDRYISEPNLAVIKRFFAAVQGPLQDLKQRATIIISAHERWQEFVSEEDLSYLGASPSWILSPMTAPEIRQLLNLRLEIAGSSYNQVFSETAFRKIRQLSQGVPRDAVGDAGILFDAAIRERKSRIDERFIRDYYETDLKNRLHGSIIALAGELPVVKKSLDALASFHEAVELSAISQEHAWRLLEQIADNEGVAHESIPTDLRPAFMLVCNMETNHSFVSMKLRQPLLAALKKIEEAGTPRREFFEAYRVRPIKVPGRTPQLFAPRSRPPVPQAFEKLAKTAEQSLVRAKAAEGRRDKVKFMRFWIEYWVVVYLRTFGGQLPSQYMEHTQGILKGTTLEKTLADHRRDLNLLIKAVRDHPKHFRTLQYLHVVADSSTESLNPRGAEPSADDVELVRLSAKRVYTEIGAKLNQ